MTKHRPPRVLEALVRLLTPRGLRDAVLGDLAECYARRLGRDGRMAAIRHYVREAWAVLGQLAPLSDEPTSLTPARSLAQGIGADFRFALRLHGRRPAATLLVVLTLGLGIGASTAIYSVIKTVLLEPLPYPYAERLVRITERDRGGVDGMMGFETLVDLRRESRMLDGIVPTLSWYPNLLGGTESVPLRGQRVGHQLFGMLGIAPALGRDFSAADDVPGAAPVAIVAATLWRDRLGADPRALGRVLSLDGIPHTVVGVLPETFESVTAPGTQVWTPLRYAPARSNSCRSCRHLIALARLAPGVSIAGATQEVNVLVGRMAAVSREDYGSGVVFIEPLKTTLIRASQRVLGLLGAAVVLVLMVVIANTAHILLGQALERRREFAVRMAVGSGRDRLVRQVLLESLLLGLVGSLVAVGMTRAVLGGIRSAAAGLPRAQAISVDWGVIQFGMLLGLVTGIVVGLLPAIASLRSASEGLALALRGRKRNGLRRVLVVGEVALASVLVVAALLLSRSLSWLLAVQPGFQPSGLVTADVKATGPAFATDSATWGYFDAVDAAVRGTPGVTSTALVGQLPMNGPPDQYGVASESGLQADPKAWRPADRYSVTPGYFETMQIPLIEGRLFGGADRSGAAPTAIVNEQYARKTFPGKSAVGERIRIGGFDPVVWRTIVGVVGDVKHDGLDQPVNQQVYVPFDQWQFADDRMSVVARVSGNARAAVAPIRRAIRAVHADPTIVRVEPMDAVLDRTLARRVIVLRFFQGFGLLALLLAAIGSYGVIASGVAERSREFGIKAALGASAARLRGSVLGETLSLGATGLLIGVPAAAWLAFRVTAAPSGFDPADPAVYVVTVAVLLVAMVTAAWGPARRAARNDPAQTLQSE